MRLTQWLSKSAKLSYQYSNLPESYIKRAMKQVNWTAPKDLPQYLPVELEKKKFRFTTNRPWTEEFRRQNQLGLHRKKVFVEPILNWLFFRGDRVEVLVGKDKGKQGMVNYIIEERNWVMVEGLNVHHRRIGKTSSFPGQMIQSESPLLVTTEVALVDPFDKQPTTAEWRFTEQGDRVRISKRTGLEIPIPKTAEETIDYKARSGYPEQEKDTKAEDVSLVTYEIKSGVFENNIKSETNIERDYSARKHSI
uniref:Large ribosomal subunit protein uL24m n=1 Tax=Evadne anonyx TaxID=141404 RepID=A0A9N6ZE65_9CRUS|nr:EOG090X0ADH [Evadne anonyx]